MGSLRQAIIDANFNNSFDQVDVIKFNIVGVSKTIVPNLGLPLITDSVLIDGTTQPGYAGVPLIELNGMNAGPNTNGFFIEHGSVEIKGLIINRFGGDGIRVTCFTMPCETYDGKERTLKVSASYIGTNAVGTSALPNGGNGIYLRPYKTSSDNTFGSRIGGVIGGNTAASRNVISGNGKNGIYIETSTHYSDDFGNYANQIYVHHNYIGPNAVGNGDLGNSMNGIYAVELNSSKITRLDASNNVVSGNNNNGVFISSKIIEAELNKNHIGTNATGTADLGNAQNGVFIENIEFKDSIIGGFDEDDANVISGNGENGLKIVRAPQFIWKNRIGTNAAGTSALGNTKNGIEFSGSGAFVDDIETEVVGNTVSGNGDDGIHLLPSASHLNFYGNRIGVNQTATAPLGNGGSGVRSAGYLIDFDEANVVGGNAAHGFLFYGTIVYTSLADTFIGTNQSGANLGNDNDGVRVISSGNYINIRGYTDENGDVHLPNTVAFNDGAGVFVTVPHLGLPGNGVYVGNNSIHSNGGLGIDLGTTYGVTPNDNKDSDSGANGLQNFPVLVKVSPVQIYGTLNSKPNKTYSIRFYRSPACDASGYGEGRYYLGRTDVTTDGSGNGSFNASGIPVVAGQIITATATEENAIYDSNTSEFSQCSTAVNFNPGNISFSAATYMVNENAGTVSITVKRAGGADGAISVNYATSNATATSAQDYAATSGTLNFAEGETTKTFTIPITNDNSDEPAETVNLSLSNPLGGATLESPATAVLTINDNDSSPTVSIYDVSLAEGNEATTAFNFAVSLSAASAFPVAVNYQTANVTANTGMDFQAASGTINFAAGEMTKQITIQVIGELLVESNEVFYVNLSAPTMSTIADGQGIGTITDDDNPGNLQFIFAGFSVNEGAPNAIIEVSRTNGNAGTVTVNYASANGTATAGTDYTAVSGTLTFGNGESSKAFTVPILPDVQGEANETVNLSLFNVLGGAQLGTKNAILTISDDDGGLPANVSIGGKINADNAPAANVLVTLSGSNSQTVLTDSQGNYNFKNLAAGGNYLITPTQSGLNFEPSSLSFSNLAANVTNADFATSNNSPQRKIMVMGGDTVGGNSVVVPIELVSQGNENSVGFSLSYDPNLLSNPQVALGTHAPSGNLTFNSGQNGKLGVLIALQSGQMFESGNRQIAAVTFQTVPTNLYSTPVAFSNQPVAGEITDPNANVLPFAIVNGLVTFAQGYESDVAPRPTGTGNGTITVADYTQIGKFVAGIEQPDQLNEFQRVDSAPRGTKGNGAVSVSDYAQAGRYAAGLDAVQTAGGASASALFNFTVQGNLTEESLNLLFGDALQKSKIADSVKASQRKIRVVDAQSPPGQQVFVSVEIDAVGDENGFGFTLNYDGSKLSAPLVGLGSELQTANMFTNTLQNGKVGIVLALPTGQNLTAGTKQLVTIRFDVSPTAGGGQTALTFADNPVFREVVNANADVLPTDFAGGSINILGPTAASVKVGGRVTFGSKGRGIQKAKITLTNAVGEMRTAMSNTFGYYNFAGVPAGETYIITAASKQLRFTPENLVINVLEDMSDVNFTSQPAQK
jgi:DNA/RNA endonuclease YhcR with UshA esterase domain